MTRALKPPSTVVAGQFVWGYVVVFLAFHLMMPLALVPYLFSWTGVALVFLGNYVFGSLGINVGYHRLLTHRGFTCPKWLEYGLALLGACSLQDSPGRWVAIHRMHHQHSDEQPDPHSPLVSFLWGHFQWLIVENRSFNRLSTLERYARDVFQDRFYLRLHRHYTWLWIYAAHALAFLGAGTLAGWAMTGTRAGAVQFGLSIFVWGVIVRTVYVWHITWAVNSVTHLWGYQNYRTGENSRNNWIVALLTNGEGWHNNHHAHQRSARHGHRWWELDLTYASIVALRWVGLAGDIVVERTLEDRPASHPRPHFSPPKARPVARPTSPAERASGE